MFLYGSVPKTQQVSGSSRTTGTELTCVLTIIVNTNILPSLNSNTVWFLTPERNNNMMHYRTLFWNTIETNPETSLQDPTAPTQPPSLPTLDNQTGYAPSSTRGHVWSTSYMTFTERTGIPL